MPKVSAAIISKEELMALLESHVPKNTAVAYQAWADDPTNGIWWEEYEGFTVQTLAPFGSTPGGTAVQPDDIDYQLLTAFVRPHSKEELIAAEMWPKEEEG